MKIDVWRILVVYKFGGIYCDIDMHPTAVVNETYPITKRDDAFFLTDAVSQKHLTTNRIISAVLTLSQIEEQTVTVVFCNVPTTSNCILHNA
jgi:hypothetical protein